MKMRLALIGLCMLALGGCGVQPQLLAMRKITSSEGWPGTAFYSNGVLESEELDTTGKTGIVDLWRYYEKGVLVRQFSDRNRDGQIDEKKFYDDEGVLIILQTDTNYDGNFDYYKDLRIKEPRQPVNNAETAGSRSGGARSSGDTREDTRLTADDIFGDAGISRPVVSDPATESIRVEERVIMDDPEAAFPGTSGDSRTMEPVGEGSVVQPIHTPSGLVPTQSGHSGSIVPGPTFDHPSAGLED